MDIEKLTKNQIVLLTLMVSFMTSIATGIVTVSLMEQAPPVVTETVNRVVERTVERVVQGQAAAVAAPQTEKTVVIRDSELIPKAVETISASLVRIYSSDAANPVFMGIGVVMDNSGTIIVDQAILGENADAIVELQGTMRVRGFVTSRSDAIGVAYIAAATSTDQGPIAWKAAQFAAKRPPLGQTIVLISGRSANRVAQGLITNLPQESGVISQIETDLPKDVIIPGSPIIDADGTVVGVSTKVSRTSDASGFIAAASLLPQATTPKEKAAVNQ